MNGFETRGDLDDVSPDSLFRDDGGNVVVVMLA